MTNDVSTKTEPRRDYGGINVNPLARPSVPELARPYYRASHPNKVEKPGFGQARRLLDFQRHQREAGIK